VKPVVASSACLDTLRIEAGLPASGRELTEEYNPWEARLDDAISLDKGCYVGQEVIARLHTYKKVSRLLVRLTAQGDEGASAGEVVIPGATIQVGSETSGVVTSSARLPGGGDRVVALGYVRDEDAVGGRPAVIAAGGRMVTATIEGVAR
jgi:folate-binding protein YgfZ